MELRLNVDDKFLEKNNKGILLVDNGKIKVVDINTLTSELKKEVESCKATIVALKEKESEQTSYIQSLENKLIKVLEVFANE